MNDSTSRRCGGVTASPEAFSQRRTLRPSAGALRVARLAKREFMTATTEELVDRAVWLRPLLEANELGGEADRRVSQASIAAITDAGSFPDHDPEALWRLRDGHAHALGHRSRDREGRWRGRWDHVAHERVCMARGRATR